MWAIAGGLATLSISLLAGAAGPAQNLDNLGPSTLVRALAAAVIAGMASFPRAFLAGIAIGVVQALISFNYLDQPGLIDFLVFLAVAVAVYWQSRQVVGETQTFSFAAKARPIPERLRGRSGGSGRSTDDRPRRLLVAVAVVLPLSSPRRRGTCSTRDPRLRHLRAVAHRPDRLGGPALPRPTAPGSRPS